MATRSQVVLQPAFVLSARPFRETSLLLECLSRDHGRVGLIARGARGPRSRQRALLQVFQPLLLSWRESADLGNLNAVEANGAAVALKGEAVFCGWYLNELLLRMLHRHDPQAAVYDLYAESLRRLPQQLEPTLRRFELRLLQALGFGLDFPPALGPDRHYVFTPQLGFVAAAAHSRAVIRGDDIAALRDETLRSPSALQAAKAVLRAALAPHLGGRPLQSAQRLRELRRRVG